MTNAIATRLKSCCFKLFSFQVTDILGKYPDLMHGFNDFVERCENIGNC